MSAATLASARARIGRVALGEVLHRAARRLPHARWGEPITAFVELASLPATSTGKVQKFALRQAMLDALKPQTADTCGVRARENTGRRGAAPVFRDGADARSRGFASAINAVNPDWIVGQ